MSSYHYHAGGSLLTAFALGVWIEVSDALRRRRLRRIAAGLPGITERLGWFAAYCWHVMSH
jgi:hypothetical protein